MAVKLRSPRYPAIGLREAIQKAKLVYDKDYRNRIGKDLVAQHMGYTTLNGASLGVISAVSKFGLLEGGAEAMWITARAVDIFEREVGDPERMDAIRAAAAEPELFRDISSTFPGKVSDSAIRSHLITKRGFLPDTSAKFIKSYRETLDLVDEETNGHDLASGVDEADALEVFAAGSAPPSTSLVTMSQIPQPPAVMERHLGERELTTGLLSKSGASFRLLVSGTIGEKEIDRLIRKLQLDKEILAEADVDEEDLLGP